MSSNLGFIGQNNGHLYAFDIRDKRQVINKKILDRDLRLLKVNPRDSNKIAIS